MDPVQVVLDNGTVYLEPSLTVPMASGCLAALEGIPATEGGIQAMLVAVYLQPSPRGGIRGWTFEENGEVVPLTDANIARLLPWGGGGMDVAEKCNELYAEDLFRPLAERRSKSSPLGPTGVSTSPNPARGSKRPKRSKRSWPPVADGSPSEVPAT